MSTAFLFSKWIDEAWNKSNIDYLREVMDDNIIVHGIGTTSDSEGKEAFLSLYASLRQAIPEMHVINTVVCETDTVATLYCSVTGRSIRNKPVSYTALCAGRFENGKLVEVWTIVDYLKMYQQLGHIMTPEPEDYKELSQEPPDEKK